MCEVDVVNGLRDPSEPLAVSLHVQQDLASSTQTIGPERAGSAGPPACRCPPIDARPAGELKPRVVSQCLVDRGADVDPPNGGLPSTQERNQVGVVVEAGALGVEAHRGGIGDIGKGR